MKRRDMLAAQIAKLQEEQAAHNAEMEKDARDHARRLEIMESAVATANAQAKAKGLLHEATTRSPSEEHDTGKQVQDFQRALETVHPAILNDPKTVQMGIAKEMLDYFLKEQLLTAHRLSIKAELAKMAQVGQMQQNPAQSVTPPLPMAQQRAVDTPIA